MGMFKRNGVYYSRIKTREGKWVPQTLNTSDRVVAKARYRERERREADPSYAAAHETSLADAADDFRASRLVKGCAAGTMHMYGVKLGHILRVFGPKTPLVRLADSSVVDAFLKQRLEEGASRNTLGKELTTLRGLLKVAKRAKKFPFDLDDILPEEWETDYEPRETFLTPAQVDELVEYLAKPRAWVDKLGRKYERKDGLELNRAAFVAFVVATGARLAEARRATREQVNFSKGWVHFKITKTRRKGKRSKHVPITDRTRPLLEQALAATKGRAVMFDPWTNVIRDLASACDALRLPRVTPNDLRRTHANWLRDAGVDTSSIADVLGHVDSRMVEKVYGRLSPEQLRDRVRAAVH